jgi:Aldose 1-epimerase
MATEKIETISSDDLKAVISSDGLRIASLEFKGKPFMFPFQDVNYGSETVKSRGTHFCVPVFGKPPKTSTLFGNIPQHGPFRDMTFNIERINTSTVFSSFSIPRSAAYPWLINGQISFMCRGDEFLTRIFLYREFDGIKTPAPVNIGLHNYWMNRGGVSVFTNGYNGPIDRIIVPSFHLRYLDPVKVKLNGIGSVLMRMSGNCLKDPEIVMWTDHKNFSCVELVAANSDLFDTPKGIQLNELDFIELNISMKLCEE